MKWLANANAGCELLLQTKTKRWNRTAQLIVPLISKSWEVETYPEIEKNLGL